MLIFIFLVILVVISLIGINISKDEAKDDFFSGLGTISEILLIVSLTIILGVKIFSYSSYVNMETEREQILLDLSYSHTDKLELKKKIEKHNSKIKKTKHYYNSLWTNWFVNGYIAEMDYIDITKKDSD